MPFFSQFLSASCHPPRCHQKAYLLCRYLERLLQSVSFCPFSKKIPSFGAFAISWIILPCFDLFISEPFSNICSQPHQYGHLISILYLNVFSGFLLRVAFLTTWCDSLDLNFDFWQLLQSVPSLCVDHTRFHSQDTCHFCCLLRPRSTYDKSNEKEITLAIFTQMFLPYICSCKAQSYVQTCSILPCTLCSSGYVFCFQLDLAVGSFYSAQYGQYYSFFLADFYYFLSQRARLGESLVHTFCLDLQYRQLHYDCLATPNFASDCQRVYSSL